MFGKPKFKKIDIISYRGYEIPVYSNGISEFIGHPVDLGEKIKENKIYNIDDFPKIKNALFQISNGNDDENLFPQSIGTVRVSSNK